jgi:hypothetical protein
MRVCLHTICMYICIQITDLATCSSHIIAIRGLSGPLIKVHLLFSMCMHLAVMCTVEQKLHVCRTRS